MTTQTSTEVRHYLDGMREALADLPAAEVAEIMDDAGAHVAEVAAEMGEEFSLASLVDRLGTPRAYAEELRAAAGYPPPSAAEPDGPRAVGWARFALWSLVAGTVMAFCFALGGGDGIELMTLVGLCTAAAALLVFRQNTLLPAITRLPEAVALLDLLRRVERADSHRVLASLRALHPVWWLGRALLVAAAGVLVYGRPLVVVVGLALGALSLFAGPRARTDRRWLWISLPATGFALGLLLLLVGSLLGGLSHGSPAPVSSYNQTPSLPANVYVFDKDGKPLTDVHLYDENGRPLDAPWYGCDGESRDDNRFPRPRVVHDRNGCHEEPGVPFTVVMPTMPPTSTTPTTSPSGPASTTPAPTTTVVVVTPTTG
ncbi:MAG: hypothetical protein HOV94_42635 [Saccharothrix sp.]|nr:hypothetical protein [Saccharothrix sp.]